MGNQAPGGLRPIWLRAGVPVHTISRRLGHASPVITMSVYAHVLQPEQDQHVDRVAEWMAGGPQVPGTSITKARRRPRRTHSAW